MIVLKDAIKMAEKQSRRAAILRQSARVAQKEADTAWTSISERIKNGESSGDMLKDFIIKRFSALDKRIEERFRKLQTKFQKFSGQYIFLAETREGQAGPSASIYKYIVLSIGILSGESFILDPPQALFWFPTGNKHALCLHHDRSKQIEFKIQKGNLAVSSYSQMDLEVSRNFQILVGDQEVGNWFKKHGNTDPLKALANINHIFERK